MILQDQAHCVLGCLCVVSSRFVCGVLEAYGIKMMAVSLSGQPLPSPCPSPLAKAGGGKFAPGRLLKIELAQSTINNHQRNPRPQALPYQMSNYRHYPPPIFSNDLRCILRCYPHHYLQHDHARQQPLPSLLSLPHLPASCSLGWRIRPCYTAH